MCWSSFYDGKFYLDRTSPGSFCLGFCIWCTTSCFYLSTMFMLSPECVRDWAQVDEHMRSVYIAEFYQTVRSHAPKRARGERKG